MRAIENGAASGQCVAIGGKRFLIPFRRFGSRPRDWFTERFVYDGYVIDSVRGEVDRRP